jgi:hypothetical protein
MNTVSITDISVFDKFEVRKVWYKDQRYFPVNDIVFVLTESKNTVDYIKKMKTRDSELSKGWGQIVTPPLGRYQMMTPKTQLYQHKMST